MQITVLIENLNSCPNLICEHGLSLFIENQGTNFLFDTGASDAFLHNAKQLDIDIKLAKFLVLSHAHSDHGGGIASFLNENKTANVYIKETAFDNYFVDREDAVKYIGLDQSLNKNSRFIVAPNYLKITSGVEVFSGVEFDPINAANNGLCKGNLQGLVADTFLHEQNLIVENGKKSVLICACAHNGIINIIEHFFKLKAKMPDVVIGGFHLFGSMGQTDTQTVKKIAKYLLSTKAMCYTCHCSGEKAYSHLKEIMEDKISYIKTGQKIII